MTKTNKKIGCVAVLLAVCVFALSAAVYASSNNSGSSGFTSPSVKIKQFRESR